MSKDQRLLECFRLLEVQPDASLDEVRHAYRTLSLVWHPDRFSGNEELAERAQARQQALNTAYRELLSAYRAGQAPLGASGEAGEEGSGQAGDAPVAFSAAAEADEGVGTRGARLRFARFRFAPVPRPVLALAAVAVVASWAWLVHSRQALGFVPVRPATASHVSAAAGHACLARGDTVVCWGRGEFGETGTGRWTARRSGKLQFPAGIRQIATGLSHSCALLEDGSVRCWGGNFAGQLGDGSLEDRSGPGRVHLGARIVEISSLGHHVCALAHDGELHCWGNDTDGQLGAVAPAGSCTWDTFRFFCSDRPERVAAGRWRAVAAGGSHTCAIDEQDAVWCWGSNRYGQLGAVSTRVCGGSGGDAPCSRTPIRVPVGPARAVVTGASHTCALDHEGRAHCWGMNRYGQAGNGTYAEIATPRTVAGDLNFHALTAGGYHTCGVTPTGDLHCWGRDARGELGSASPDRCGGVACTALAGETGKRAVAAIAAGFGVTCARSEADRISCWGRGEPGLAPSPRPERDGVGRRPGIGRAMGEIRWQTRRAFRVMGRVVESLRI
jgi:alpha-tubulin suppressor-like RCC1 family protein